MSNTWRYDVSEFNAQRTYIIIVANYFRFENWDLEAAVTKIANNHFNSPVLQLQADSDPSQPKESFADVEALFPNVKLKWVTKASHFDNLDQPIQVAEAINDFLRSGQH